MAKQGSVTQLKSNHPANTPTKMMDPIERTTRGIRRVLFEEMQAMRNGKSSPTRANAISKLAMGVVEAQRLEMQYEAHRTKYPLLDGETEADKIIDFD